MGVSPHVIRIDGIRAARTLRAEVLAAATAAARDPDYRAVLCLNAPKISEPRLEEEWQAAALALRPEVFDRLSLGVRFPDGRSRFFGNAAAEAVCQWPPDPSRSASLIRLPAADNFFVVFKLLVYAWMTGRGPVTTQWLKERAGRSYPTVAAALKRLGARVVRHPDRRIELRPLQREDWNRFLVVADEARSPMRFADRSGQPRPPATLLSRLQKAWPPGVGLAGAAGARHHEPGLDLVGLPRLDLSVHSPTREVGIGFVERIDPALKPVVDAGQPAQLVLHFVRREDPIFTAKEEGFQLADPVECLLDLLDMRLDPQALEFGRRLTSRPEHR